MESSCLVILLQISLEFVKFNLSKLICNREFMGLSDNIIRLRKQLNLSQRDIADALGITDQTVSNWEQKRTEPKLTIRQTALLCHILECSLEDLDGIGDRTRASDQNSD